MLEEKTGSGKGGVWVGKEVLKGLGGGRKVLERELRWTLQEGRNGVSSVPQPQSPDTGLTTRDSGGRR